MITKIIHTLDNFPLYSDEVKAYLDALIAILDSYESEVPSIQLKHLDIQTL